MERVALAVGDQQHVARGRTVQHVRQRPAEFGAAGWSAQSTQKLLKHRVRPPVMAGDTPVRVLVAGGADARHRIVELPDLGGVAFAQMRRENLKACDHRVVLGGIGLPVSAEFPHRPRAVDEDREIECVAASGQGHDLERDGATVRADTIQW